ncbi:plastocyanin/azurin family copper-binding protein [Natrinema salaciae]|uniref:Plastocyanin n=1 Tax=Natrinema salaciae TaxID=1186196 RepID=A0A1H8ZRT2_9EURY|nr:plastocyanin/azurin family copper-binding protein [Natrinema salaciae]SEP67075.1 plastocyanin [Natrinema salaciae]
MSSDIYDRRTILRVSGTALATIGTAGCLNGRSPTDQTVTMTGDFGFDPTTATIEPGRAVTWENTSDVDHTVTAYEDDVPDGTAYFASGDFESERSARDHMREGLVAPGDEYEHTFEEPGTYEYYCVPHEGSGMVGTVRVE